MADEDLRSKSDEEQLRFAAAGDYVFVTADTRIKIREHERAALLETGVKVIEFNFPKTYTMWDRFKLMVNKWEQVEVRLCSAEYVVVRPNSVKTLAEDRRRQPAGQRTNNWR